MNETREIPIQGGPPHRAARNPGLWILAMLLVAGLFSLAYGAFVLTATGQQADDDALLGATAFLDSDTARAAALSFLNQLPLISGIVALVALLAAAILRRDLQAPIVAALSFGAAVGSTQVLKHLVLVRPNLGISEATGNSFPSGHTTVATSALIAVFLVTSPRWRPLIATCGGLYAAVTGISTFALGWHRPSDVVAAYLVAGFWGLLAGLIILRRQPGWNRWKGPDSSWSSSGIWPTLLWFPGILGFLGSAAVYLFVTHLGPTAGTSARSWFLVAGALLIIGAAGSLFGLLCGVFSHQTRGRAPLS
ncbi:phosphatase PAP2 family protein [Arthrobacter rhombi]|uniref:phosphatase PAP2 family protein n=1 Tax=Arthrobacter rhombi TaxID=71253 RepID=UPI003FD3CEAC